MSQLALAGTSSLEVEDFVDAKFYCPRALADGKGMDIIPHLYCMHYIIVDAHYYMHMHDVCCC